MAIQCFSQDFTKALDGWLERNEQKYALALSKAQGIPDHFMFEGTLYRGMVVDADFMNLVQNGKMKFDSFTSWTRDKKVAEKFMKDPRFKTTNKSGIGIIITKKVKKSDCVLDIYSYSLFTGGVGLDPLSFDSAIKEQEVLLKKGLKISDKDIKIV